MYTQVCTKANMPKVLWNGKKSSCPIYNTIISPFKVLFSEKHND